MNNFYALIYLTEYLKTNCQGHIFLFSYSPHKNVWESYISWKDITKRLVFSANSTETALFLDNERPSKKTNVTTFFELLEEKEILGVSLAKNDRFITIHFSTDLKLVFQLFGSKPNIFLVREDEILEAFKGNQEIAGKPAPKPRPPVPHSHKKTDNNKNEPAKKKIIETDRTFPRHLIQPVIQQFNLDGKTADQIKSVVDQLTTAMKERPEFRVLDNGNVCLVPSDLLPLQNRKVFDNVNDAIRFAHYETSRHRRLSARLQSIKPKIDKTLERHQSTIAQLKKADRGLERSRQYEEYGHILMAHAHQTLESGAEVITLPNFYDANKPVEIPVKSSLSIAGNAQQYYEKSTKALRNVEVSKHRLKEILRKTDRLTELRQAVQSIEKIPAFDRWYKEHESELRDLGILAKIEQKNQRPYRRTTIDNYEIWIGKNAKSNDRLTSQAHKEDIWLHARGVSGSHVVIRMNNQKEMPPKPTILKAAAVAAWHSKARGSELVPVIVAKRKYITRPKGAAPGTVRVQREEIEMVKPEEYRTPIKE